MSISKDPNLELTLKEATRRAREDEEFLSNLLVANFDNPDTTIAVDKLKLRHIYGTLNRIEHVARVLDYELDKKYKLINTMEEIYKEDMKK